MSTEKKELTLTARTTFVIEMEHKSNWDIECKAEQVFNAGDRENTNALEEMIREWQKTNRGTPVRILSHDTSVVVLGKKVRP